MYDDGVTHQVPDLFCVVLYQSVGSGTSANAVFNTCQQQQQSDTTAVMKQKIRQRITLLAPLLKDPGFEVQQAAAQAIERLEAHGDLDEILAALKTGDTGSRVAAIYALGKIGGDKVLAPLLYCAGRPEADLRAAAIQVLGEMAHASSFTTVAAALDDESTAVQAKAIAALAYFTPNPAICARLRLFLEASDGTLEAEAALALARLGDIAATHSIVALLSSPHPATRAAAAQALSLLPL